MLPLRYCKKINAINNCKTTLFLMQHQSFVIDWMILWCHKCKIIDGLFFYFSYICKPWFHLTAFQVILSLLQYFLKCTGLLREKNFNFDLFDELLVLFSLFNLPFPLNCALNALSILSEVDAYFDLASSPAEEVLITSQTYVLSSPQSDTGTQQIKQGMVTIYTSLNKTISSLSTSFLIASNWSLRSFWCNRYP